MTILKKLLHGCVFDWTLGPSCALVRISVAVKRRDTVTMAALIKEKHFIEVAAYSSKVLSIISMAGNMAACRLSWCWLHFNQKATGSDLTITLSEA